MIIVKKPLLNDPARLQSMLLKLQKYNFTLVYKQGKELHIADTLSRAPNQDSSDKNHDLEVMTILPISDARLRELITATASDLDLQKLANTVHNGWPVRVSSTLPETRPYFPFRAELTIHEHGLVMNGDRMIIPKSLQATYVQILHEGHPGLDATKRRARDTVYWPSMCKDIEHYVTSCAVCNSCKPHQQKEPLKS